MSQDKQLKKLNKQLKSIIKKMKKTQRSIAADAQPVSMSELDTLKRLGIEYQDVTEALRELEQSD